MPRSCCNRVLVRGACHTPAREHLDMAEMRQGLSAQPVNATCTIWRFGNSFTRSGSRSDVQCDSPISRGDRRVLSAEAARAVTISPEGCSENNPLKTSAESATLQGQPTASFQFCPNVNSTLP